MEATKRLLKMLTDPLLSKPVTPKLSQHRSRKLRPGESKLHLDPNLDSFQRTGQVGAVKGKLKKNEKLSRQAKINIISDARLNTKRGRLKQIQRQLSVAQSNGPISWYKILLARYKPDLSHKQRFGLVTKARNLIKISRLDDVQGRRPLKPTLRMAEIAFQQSPQNLDKVLKAGIQARELLEQLEGSYHNNDGSIIGYIRHGKPGLVDRTLSVIAKNSSKQSQGSIGVSSRLLDLVETAYDEQGNNHERFECFATSVAKSMNDKEVINEVNGRRLKDCPFEETKQYLQDRARQIHSRKDQVRAQL